MTSLPTPNEQADEELLMRLQMFADHYVEAADHTDVKQMARELNSMIDYIAQHTKAAERLARIEELEEVKKYFPEYASASTAKLLLCVNNRIVVLEAELAAAQKDTK